METQDRNKIIIIAAVVLVLLCCCCLALVVAWYTGDYFVNAINELSTLFPALPVL